jgi:hypothetical protein
MARNRAPIVHLRVRYEGYSRRETLWLVRRLMTLSVTSPPSIAAVQKAYSITSSARASTLGGMMRPSDFAVLGLIASSYLVGACTWHEMLGD